MMTTNPTREYRVTFPDLYRDPACAGNADLTARQGHYVKADGPEEAADAVLRYRKAEPVDVQSRPAGYYSWSDAPVVLSR